MEESLGRSHSLTRKRGENTKRLFTFSVLVLKHALPTLTVLS